MCLVCTLAFGATTVTAQGLQVGKFPVKAFYFSYGNDQDLLSSMDNEYFQRMAKRPNANLEAMSFRDVDIESMICENPNLELGLVLELPRRMELSLGVTAIFNRVDALSYNWRRNGNADYGNINYMNFSTYADEFGVEASLLKRLELTFWKNRLNNSPINLYVGAGTNVGLIVNNELYAYGSQNYTVESYSYNNYTNLRSDVANNPDYEYYNERVDLKGGFTQRIYGEAAIGFTLIRRVEVGLQGKYGYGYRAMGGAGWKTTNLKSIGLFARALLN